MSESNGIDDAARGENGMGGLPHDPTSRNGANGNGLFAQSVEEVSIEEEEPIPVEDFQEMNTPVPIVRRVSERAAASVASSVQPLVADLPRDDLARIAREVIEKIAWEVVPELAETLIREELDRLLEE